MKYVTMDWPTKTRRITQYFGERPDVYRQVRVAGVRLRGHNGLDIAASFEPVYAPFSGVVVEADDEGNAVPGFGKYIKLADAGASGSTPAALRASSSYHVVLAHLSRVDVRPGQRVTRGQQLGVSGNSGWSTGPHLHLGLRIKPYNRADGWGGYVNPLPHLLQADVQALAVVGPYWEPAHRDATDDSVMRRWRPAVIKLERNGWDNPRLMTELYRDLPATYFVWRDHAWAGEGRHGELMSDPGDFGRRHADAMIKSFESIRARGGVVDPGRTLFMATNEPPIWRPGWKEALATYSVAFMATLTRRGFLGLIGNFAVGWPGNSCQGCAPEWGWFSEALAWARAGGHVVSNHEYWADGGPMRWDRWWARRGEAMPDLQVQRIVGECGYERRVQEPGVETRRAGWAAWMDGQAYLGQLAEYGRMVSRDSRLIGAAVFIYDYNNRELWPKFDVRPLRDELPAALAPTAPRAFSGLYFHDEAGGTPPRPEDDLARCRKELEAALAAARRARDELNSIL